MNRAVRRTGTYFHSLACWSAPSRVRAPQTTVPKIGKVRRQLTPSGLSPPFSRSVSRDGEAARRAGSASVPAGAFQTPRVGVGAGVDPGQRAAGRDAARPVAR